MRKLVIVLCVVASMFLLGGLSYAQMGNPPTRDGREQTRVLRLSFKEAIGVALKNNYDLLLAVERVSEAHGVSDTRFGAMLPNLRGATDWRRIKVFQGVFGGAPVASSPRDIWDTRASLTQSLFSLSLIQNWRAGRTGIDIADYESAVARRDTIATAALLYMETLRAKAAVKAREANVRLNRALLRLTQGRKRAGAATGIDVVRAKGQLEAERRLLLVAKNEAIRGKLNLLRALGISSATRIELTDNMEMKEAPPQSIEESVRMALRNRAEIKAQAGRGKFAQLSLASIQSETVPVLDVRGDYGIIGEDDFTRTNSYSFGLFISVPIFDGQRDGRITETRSQFRQAEIQLRGLMLQISVETREAYQTLHSTYEQTLIAKETLALALEELQMSEKAFSIGTLTHFEIIGAQIRVAGARDTAIESLFNYNAARINSARAQGRINLIYEGGSMLVDRPSSRPLVHKVMARATGRR